MSFQAVLRVHALPVLVATFLFLLYSDGRPIGNGHEFFAKKDSEEACAPFLQEDLKLTVCPKRGNFPLKDSCRVFQFCSGNGTRPRTACCASGSAMDHKLRKCVENPEAVCKDVCAEAGARFPDPENDQGYLECKERGVPEPVACPPDNTYSVNDKECMPSSTQPVVENAPPDPEDTAGDGAEDGESVTAEGRGFTMNFKAQFKAQYKFGAKGCGPSDSQRYERTCNRPGNLPLKNECDVYITCYGVGKEPKFACCPPNLHFDHKSRTCREKNEAKCMNVCPRDGEKFPDPHNPHGYLQCENGVPVDYPCPKNHRYEPYRKRCEAMVIKTEKMIVTTTAKPTDEDNTAAILASIDMDSLMELVAGYDFPDPNEAATTPKTEGSEATTPASPGDEATTAAPDGSGDVPPAEGGDATTVAPDGEVPPVAEETVPAEEPAPAEDPGAAEETPPTE